MTHAKHPAVTLTHASVELFMLWLRLLKAPFCIVSSTLENHSSGSCYLTAGAQLLFCGLAVQSWEVHRTCWVTGTQTWSHTSAFGAVVWNPSGVQYPAVPRTSTGTRLCILETEVVLSVLCQILLAQFRLGSTSMCFEMNLCKLPGFLYETVQLHFNIALLSGCE